MVIKLLERTVPNGNDNSKLNELYASTIALCHHITDIEMEMIKNYIFNQKVRSQIHLRRVRSSSTEPVLVLPK